MSTVVVLQSNYIPWKGYFDLIHDADLFVFHDDLQYTKGDWRNRNRIKTSTGIRWLTIPVGSDTNRLICDVAIPDPTWQIRHWNQLLAHYRATPFLHNYKKPLEAFYLKKQWKNLSSLNQALIRFISTEFLGVSTRFADSRDLRPEGTKQERLLDLLKKVGATRYVSGPSAKGYVTPAAFEASGIELVWKDYSGYPDYPQVHTPFEHSVSILDLLFHLGPRSSEYIWGWRTRESKLYRSPDPNLS